jgi:multisubunit Na+/H+ antiporter MnhG subunit
MKEKTLNRIIYAVMMLGLIMMVTGIGLATFTNIASGGGFMLLALLIAVGMLLLAPSKMYLTFQMMRKNDEKLQKKNTEQQALKKD